MGSDIDHKIARLELFGPKIFDLGGSISIWIDIIGSLDTDLINSLLKLIENKSCDEKFILAKRIITDGFDKVIIDSKPKTTTIETLVDSQSQEVADNERLITHDISSDESILIINTSVEESNESNDCDQSISISEEMAVDEESIELIIPLNKSSELIDSSDDYMDAPLDPLPEALSPDSFKSALDSPNGSINSSPKKSSDFSSNKSREILFESPILSSYTSTPSKTSNEDRLSGQILTLSPITSMYSQSKISVSPTISLNMSSTSSQSPKSTVSSRTASKRSPTKTVESIIEEYKCLVPYDSYSSEQKYFKSSNETNTQSDSVISDPLYDQIIEQNIKTIESNDS